MYCIDSLKSQCRAHDNVTVCTTAAKGNMMIRNCAVLLFRFSVSRSGKRTSSENCFLHLSFLCLVHHKVISTRKQPIVSLCIQLAGSFPLAPF